MTVSYTHLKEKVQMEKRIEKLIKKMTLEEKVGLLHGNSKFYVAGVELSLIHIC